jgi:hypothetical protein
MGYMVVGEPSQNDVIRASHHSPDAVFLTTLAEARKVAAEILAHPECPPGRDTVLIFEINPIARIILKRSLNFSEQEIQPVETWRQGDEDMKKEPPSGASGGATSRDWREVLHSFKEMDERP